MNLYESIDIKRHDASSDQSLRAYSAADEYLLKAFHSLFDQPVSCAIYHDRFGYLTCHLHAINPITILANKSQEKAILLNLEINNLALPSFSDPLSDLNKKLSCALFKIPKSLALFEMYLYHISKNANEDVVVVTAFMTRHFSAKMVEVAEKYFDNVAQSKAVKKARLLTLSKKKTIPDLKIIESLDFNNTVYKQYLGVFSSKHIDYATQFFLDHMELNSNHKCVLDLASGNGVIGNEILKVIPEAEVYLMDDFFLAVASAKLNVQGENVHHCYSNNLSFIENDYFNLIVSNPPFHFEYEINISIPIGLFSECYRCLKTNGNLQIVANKHLNYATHLRKLFSTVVVLAENEKFVVYKCNK